MCSSNPEPAISAPPETTPPSAPVVAVTIVESEPPATPSIGGGGVEVGEPEINFKENKYPFCIVWRPINVLTWIVPFLGHVGIGMSNGVIRDFAKSYDIKEDDFGKPAKYMPLNPRKVPGGAAAWDNAVLKATETYAPKRLHPPFFDNCYSYVGQSLSLMQYKGNERWHMGYRAPWVFFGSKYVGFYGFLWTWLPFVIVIISVLLVCYLFL